MAEPHDWYFDGWLVGEDKREGFEALRWDLAYVDPGPSLVGNPGPYLKVPWPANGTEHRLYPRTATAWAIVAACTRKAGELSEGELAELDAVWSLLGATKVSSSGRHGRANRC